MNEKEINNMNENNQKDLVLSINEYAYVLDETKGHVSCLVGPTKMSLSQSDKLVRFDSTTKSFVPCSYDKAKSLFTTIPENWYCILKNPVEGNKHPAVGTSNTLPENIHIGQKINVRGPASFALYPGQMAKVIRGHALRSNQYLLARVYEAEVANNSQGEIRDAEGNLIENTNKYVNGQILVIKGTEVSFYIPPTGIEVIPVNNNTDRGYTRNAVTLERLEYCILKDEDGNKRYVHGPEVVFPKPTETFVTNANNNYIFKAIELSPISGIYIKVIAEYTDENGTVHPVGEEQFITGSDQMIYYPRPEHATITYDGKMMHHAIAIPAGEGRYIMNRLTGDIKTVKGPAMYLPDPRTEVVVKRKLTPSQCSLWFPGNNEAMAYNMALNEKSVEKSLKNATTLDSANCCATSSSTTTLAAYETNAGISRGNSYTKPRTITLDSKYEGVVSIDVWTGYAVNVISKSQERKTICGPTTILLDYDQTLEVLSMSTGKPKTDKNPLRTVFLRYANNKVSDIISIETKDYVRADVKVSYCVNFDLDYQDKWFTVDNYVKYLCDRERSLIKRAAKEYTIEEFYRNYSKIIRDVAIGKHSTGDGEEVTHTGLFFNENGMYVYDCEVLDISVEQSIEALLEQHQYDMVSKALELSDAEQSVAVAKALADADRETRELRHKELMDKIELERIENETRLEIASAANRKKEAEKKAAYQAQADCQALLDAINQAESARTINKNNIQIQYEKDNAEIEKARMDAYAASVKNIMNSISPDLVAAMGAKSNAELVEVMAKNVGPYAIAQGESVVDTTTKLIRGTGLEEFFKNFEQVIGKKVE
jgi:major vault protein